MGSAPATNIPSRRRLRFGLRTMLIAIAAIAIVCGWVARARQQRDSVAVLRASNPSANLLYDYQAGESGWGLRSLERDRFESVRRWLGVDYFASVAALELHYATDADLRLIGRFGELTQLFLWRGVDLTDEGLANLRRLGKLKKLSLQDPINITDDGFEHLARLTSLEELSVSLGPRVTSAGIMKLGKLSRLKRLDLSCHNADATAAVDELRRMLPNCRIRGSSADDIR